MIARRVLAPLVGKDLIRYRFEDPRWAPVRTGDCEVAAAVYHRAEEALFVIGNLASDERTVRCCLDTAATDLAPAAEYAVQIGAAEVSMTGAQIGTGGIEVALAGDDVTVVTIRPRP